MEINNFGWLISELRFLKNEYKYLESVCGSYYPLQFCYIVYFNCDFCGEFLTISVSVADDMLIDMNLVKKIVTTFSAEYSGYEKLYT